MPATIALAGVSLAGFTCKVLKRKRLCNNKKEKKQTTYSDPELDVANDLSKTLDVTACSGENEEFYQVSCEGLSFYVCFLEVDGMVNILGCCNGCELALIRSTLTEMKKTIEEHDREPADNCMDLVGGFIVNSKFKKIMIRKK